MSNLNNCLSIGFNENQNFDWKLQLFWQNMQSQVVQVLNPFLSFMHFYPKGWYVVHDVRPLLQGFGVGHLVCWQGKQLQIVGEYDH
jgi:hypothetical protein